MPKALSPQPKVVDREAEALFGGRDLMEEKEDDNSTHRMEGGFMRAVKEALPVSVSASAQNMSAAASASTSPVKPSKVVGDAGPMADLGPEQQRNLSTVVMHDEHIALALHPPSVAIIGAGWYGCHIAKVLLEKNAKVTVFERENDVFAGSSAKHQFRLHVGFHYPRAYSTRMQILESFERFQKVYPDCFLPIDDNIYCVAENDSLLDFGTYLQVVQASKLPYQLVNPLSYGIENVGGAMKCQERGLIANAPRLMFRELLKDNLKLNTHVERIVHTTGVDYEGNSVTKVLSS